MQICTFHTLHLYFLSFTSTPLSLCLFSFFHFSIEPTNHIDDKFMHWYEPVSTAFSLISIQLANNKLNGQNVIWMFNRQHGMKSWPLLVPHTCSMEMWNLISFQVRFFTRIPQFAFRESLNIDYCHAVNNSRYEDVCDEE